MIGAELCRTRMPPHLPLRHPPPPPLTTLLLLLLLSATSVAPTVTSDEETHNGIAVLHPHPSHFHQCYSCASNAYLSVWNQLMHHYFPPKNFTDRCWNPDPDVGTIHCRTACFTIVEEVYEHYSGQGVLRGCVDRLLLFGLDDDVRDAITSYENSCRTTDRHLLQMVALSPENHLVLMCTCSGRLCNDRDMEYVLSGASRAPLLLLIPFLLPLLVRRV